MRNILWEPEAWDSYVEFQSQKQLLRRINTLVKDIQRNGYKCSYGKPEMLKHDLLGLASVRIDQKNRLVFRVDKDTVDIAQCGTHYGDH